eukprot:TRINITY_DN7343_c0_g1_i1.p2 TRINITY_DN7343_c0_g1~~TRINITY_DN7343_c0_g1_i1.p2  ORF type:complete len:174 (-),score=46.37 TRINITY_DN7343_c0_g1_i1:552-998(-)
MARGRSSGGGRRAAPARAPARAPAPAPKPQQTAPAHPPSSGGGGGLLSGMASTVAQGFAFGTGSAMAHRAVGAVAGSFGGSGSEAEQQQEPAAGASGGQYNQQSAAMACDNDKQNFFKCLQEQNGNAASCQFLYESLQSCQANHQQFA